MFLQIEKYDYNKNAACVFILKAFAITAGLLDNNIEMNRIKLCLQIHVIIILN